MIYRKIDPVRRKLLVGMGALAANSLLSPLSALADKKNVNSLFQAALSSPATNPSILPQGYNILFIVTDQERYFSTLPVPLAGRQRLLKTGIQFCQHQNNTNVCTSSRSVIYTGLHMQQTKMFDNIGMPWMDYDLDAKLGTIGHLMQQLGYYSAYKGKWHLHGKIDNPLPNERPLDIGHIPTNELHNIMQQYGFADYEGVGDIIGSCQGGYFYDSVRLC